VHAYGVVRADLDTDREQLPDSGIGGTPVRLLPMRTIAVVVGDLDAGDFGEAAWQQHAEDPAWLEPVARGHHQVLQALAATSDVLPLRLPGIYRDDDGLTEALASEEDRLLERLLFVAGHREWGVQVFGGAMAEPGTPAPTTTQTSAATSGRDYLLRRKQAASQRDEARASRQRLLLEAHRALADVATSSVVNRPQDRALSGRSEPMLLNSAHLVARDAEQRFFEHADQVSREVLEPAGLVMEISGPWPPYNFVTPADQEPLAEEAR
jgi:hypothetical protein